MGTYRRHLDSYLQSIRPHELVALAQGWGAPPMATPDAALAAILAALNDPARLGRLIASLSAQEQTALALAQFMGGMIDAEVLTAALRVVGFPCAASGGGAIGDPLIDLVRRGFLLHDSSYEPLTISTRYGPCRLVADDRLLAQINPMTCVPLALDPCPPPAAIVVRAPASVTLDVLTLLRTIDQIGGLKPTSTGALRVADVRRLARALGWPAAEPAIAGVPFLSAIPSLIMILWSADVIACPSGVYGVSPHATAFFQQPSVEQIRTLLRSGLQSQRWQEWPDPPWRDVDAHRQYQWRLVLISALMALPPAETFVSIDDLVDALFVRIGRTFSLAGPVARPLFRYREALPVGQSAEDAWHAQLETTWHNRERRWIGRALATWLTWLGIVEVSLVDDAPVAVRLTNLGRTILQPWHPSPADAQPRSDQPAWVVQPNFEILVYLDRVAADLLPMLDQHAERIQVEAHIARYRLTHEAVYAGLEQGGTLDALVGTLRRGAGKELPQNVLTTLQEWARQREQITVYRQARLLEYRDARARQKALDAGQTGTPIGQRFVLLLPATDLRGKTRIDYAKPRSPCLAATELGTITLTKPADLFLTATLDAWAERTADGGWQCTAMSVAAALTAQQQIATLLGLLKDHLTHPVPPLIEVALRAWAGDRPTSTLGTALVFRCQQPAVVRVIAQSESFRPYIREVLGPTALLIDDWQVEAFRERLAWAGLDEADRWDIDEHQG
jgi:Helicase conserved C-terminal domain